MQNMERLHKVLAHAGVGSRRQCESSIKAGRVSVDGQVVRELGTKVEPGRRISVDDQPIQEERHVYWIVNKPRGYLCTNRDPAGRPLAIDLVPHVSQRVYTVGRLDEDSEDRLPKGKARKLSKQELDILRHVSERQQKREQPV